jgi:hypothetical protein
MAFENMEEPEVEVEESPAAEGTSNRTFVIVAAALGGIVLLSLICLAVYALVLKPRQTAGRQATETAISQANAEVATSVKQTELAIAQRATEAAKATNTPLPTAVTLPLATATPVVAAPTSVITTPTQNPSTATAFAKTAAAQQLTLTALHTTPGATALPTTGFMDDVGGIPFLLGAALLLVLVIFLARRLRMAS